MALKIKEMSEGANKENLARRATVVGLDSNSTEAQVVSAELKKDPNAPNQSPNIGTLASRAAVVGLASDSSEEAIEVEEKRQFPKGTLSSRAIAVGLDYDSSEAQILIAETSNKKK